MASAGGFNLDQGWRTAEPVFFADVNPNALLRKQIRLAESVEALIIEDKRVSPDARFPGGGSTIVVPSMLRGRASPRQRQ
jgi:hypothetical protein